MIVALFPEQAERAKAMGVWGFVSSGGGTLGVILGGVLTQSVGWHWIFLVNVPIGAAALALSRPLLPSTPGTGLGKALDVAGTLAVVVAPLLVVYGVVAAGLDGWASVVTLVCLGAAVLVIGAFVLIESRAAVPLMPLGIFRNRTTVVTNVLMGLRGCHVITGSLREQGGPWEEGIIPVPVKHISTKVDDGEFVVGHLSPGGVSIGIQFTSDLEPRCGRSGPDQVDHHFMTDKRFATPVLGDGREQPVFNFVPLAGTRGKVTHRNFQPGFIC